MTSIMWMVDSMADSDPSKPDFDIWEDLLNNATKGGRDVTNQLTIFSHKIHALLTIWLVITQTHSYCNMSNYLKLFYTLEDLDINTWF